MKRTVLFPALATPPLLAMMAPAPVAGPAAADGFYRQRRSASSFTFVVQADPHLDGNSSPDVSGRWRRGMRPQDFAMAS